MQCDFSDCDHLSVAHNLCAGHYGQRRRGKPLTPLRSSYRKGCSVEGCNGKHGGRGFCNKHYKRWLHHGDPSRTPRTPLVDRLADKIDLNGPIPTNHPELGPCWIWTGGSDGRYGCIRDETSQHRHAHIVVWEYIFGQSVPVKHDLHHRCENPICVNPEHMIPLTRSEHKLAHVAFARLS
jgi:hypothetical protein